MSNTGKLVGSVVEIEDENGVHCALVLDRRFIANYPLETQVGKKIALRVEIIDETSVDEVTKKELGICHYCERAFGSHNPSCPKPE